MTELSPYWINIAGGIAFDIERPTAAMIEPHGIMHQLAMIPRWGGNVAWPYSVLQHSIIVAENLTQAEDKIYGFIHDWPEALLGGDVSTPWKLYFHSKGLDVNAIERRFMNLIYQRLGIPAPSRETAERVHETDQRALATEFRDVVHGKTPHWCPPAPPFGRAIKYVPWDKNIEQAHVALDSYLYFALGLK